MRKAKYSRERLLIQTLRTKNQQKALRALFFIIDEMNVEKGFSRHDGTDYYLHIIDVTQDLINNGIDNEDILTAAILHDALEDIPGVSLLYLTQEYGAVVAHMVDLVTKDKSINYHTNDTEMKAYLSRISENVGAALIKTADRIHNFSTMREGTSVEHKRKQVRNTETFFFPFFKECRNAYPYYSHYFYGAKYAIEPILYATKEYIDLYDQHNQPH